MVVIDNSCAWASADIFVGIKWQRDLKYKRWIFFKFWTIVLIFTYVSNTTRLIFKEYRWSHKTFWSAETLVEKVGTGQCTRGVVVPAHGARTCRMRTIMNSRAEGERHSKNIRISGTQLRPGGKRATSKRVNTWTVPMNGWWRPGRWWKVKGSRIFSKGSEWTTIQRISSAVEDPCRYGTFRIEQAGVEKQNDSF